MSRWGYWMLQDQGSIVYIANKTSAWIKIIKEAQTLGIHLSDIVSLKSDQEDLDWKLVGDYLIQKQKRIEQEVDALENQKKRIEGYQISIERCVQGLDSDL